MNDLKIPDRIDNAVNILQSVPGLQGFNQWNPICEAIKILIGISMDVQAWAKDHPQLEDDAGADTPDGAL